ncbi:MAG: LamG-like jellyroll fold domain-containing protein, partial [Pseudomonadota bacterium]
LRGEAGDDTLRGGGGNDSVEGGYGDDALYGGAGGDTLDGGRGSDLLMGGDGHDLLRSTSDAGEQRAGQLVLGEPSRPFPDDSIDPEYLKLVDWTDQTLVADDILVGGRGRDHFYFEAQINAKFDIIQKHVMADRSIHWHGVAGENRRIHDHWVDHFGIDVIADYNASEDTISVIGHTTRIEVDYQLIDRNGDGVDDDAVSIITAYSQQGAGGGAHDEDLIGFIVVHGDLVDEDDVNTDPGVHYGIVDTIDELQEALAPTGETKRSVGPQGEELFGYDSRDVEGDPLAADPEAYAENPYSDQVDYASGRGGGGPIGMIDQDSGGVFNGSNFVEIPHQDGFAQADGTWALSFTADAPGGRKQGLLSKDHSGYKDGGHLNIYLDEQGRVIVRFQSQNESIHLRSDTRVEAGEEHHVAFSFDASTVSLYVDGVLEDAEAGFRAGMTGNAESVVVGASTHSRWNDDKRLDWFFDGEITDVVALDRPLTGVEALLLAGADGDPASLSPGAPSVEGPIVPDDAPPETPNSPEGGVTRIGNDGENRLVGTHRGDVMDGKRGKDELISLGGDDFIDGGGGGDRIQAGKGEDTLIGGHGRDMLIGREHSDELYGGLDNDTLKGGSGDDVLFGGKGFDHLYGGAGADVFGVGGGLRDVIYDFQDGIDVIALESPDTNFSQLRMQKLNNDVVVAYDGGTIQFKNTKIGELDANDFMF